MPTQEMGAFKTASCELTSVEEAVAGLDVVAPEPLSPSLPLPLPLVLPEPEPAAPGMPPESPDPGAVHGGFNSNTVLGPKFDPRMIIGALKISLGRVESKNKTPGSIVSRIGGRFTSRNGNASEVATVGAGLLTMTGIAPPT